MKSSRFFGSGRPHSLTPTCLKVQIPAGCILHPLPTPPAPLYPQREHVVPFRKHPPTAYLCPLLRRASRLLSCFSCLLSLSLRRTTEVSLLSLLPSFSPFSHGDQQMGPLLEKALSGSVFSCPHSLPLLAPSPPTAKVLELDGGCQPRLKWAAGSMLCLDRYTPNPTPPVRAPAWWPWGPGLGWVPGLEGRQGCWPVLACRSHSSPGKAENRRPLCPGILSATSLMLLPH